ILVFGYISIFFLFFIVFFLIFILIIFISIFIFIFIVFVFNSRLRGGPEGHGQRRSHPDYTAEEGNPVGGSQAFPTGGSRPKSPAKERRSLDNLLHRKQLRSGPGTLSCDGVPKPSRRG